MSITSAELHQTIRLVHIPDGWKMQVTAVKATSPETNKYTSIVSTPGGQESNSKGAWNNFRPFEVSKYKENNKVATIELEPHTTKDIAIRPAGEIYFKITGATMVDGKPVEANSKGVLIVTSTPWGYFTRPDYSIVTVALDGVARTTVNGVPASTDPAEIQLSFSTDGSVVTLVAAPGDRTLSDKIANFLIQGLLEAHRDLFMAGVPFPMKAVGLLGEGLADFGMLLAKKGGVILYGKAASAGTFAKVDAVKDESTCS